MSKARGTPLNSFAELSTEELGSVNGGSWWGGSDTLFGLDFGLATPNCQDAVVRAYSADQSYAADNYGDGLKAWNGPACADYGYSSDRWGWWL
jgi:hypothetical protein